MPPRLARANVASNTSSASKKPKNKNKKRALNAYASAARQIPESRLNRNRMGEDLDDAPRKKRARDEDDEDDEELDDEDEPQRKKVANRGIASMHDDLQHGSDSEGNEWTMGGIASGDEESDLDSDEAFGESDEEKFKDFTFRGSEKNKKKKKRKSVRKEVDLDESESEIDDGDSQDDEGETFGEDGVDLATMLDDDSDEDMEDSKNKTAEGESGSGSEEDDEESDDDSASDEDDDDESVDEEAAARNMDRIAGLDPSARGPTQDQEGVTTVDDFMDSSIAPLPPVKSKKSKKAKEITQLAAKLPKRQQDRIDREIASAKAKEQLNRWQDTVKRHRREEFLTFPLQDPTDQSGITGKEKFLPATQQAPQSELEASIQRIMQESGLQTSKPAGEDNVGDEEQALLKSEELATNKLPVEEVLRRRAELRKMRELLFREEIKAKRIAKIKSKSYRRVHRKERERLAEQEKQMMEGLGGEAMMDEDAKEKQDRKRAEARMSTKHKDSKWAKSLKATGRAVWDEGARDGVVEQARREEELRRRMDGGDVSDDDSEGSLSPSDDDDDDEDDGFTLRKLEGERNDGKEKKGLAGMKFMREAEERKQKANDEDVARLRKELDGNEDDSEQGEESLGRAIFGPQSTASKPAKAKEQRLEFEAPDHSADEDDDEGQDGEGEVKIVTEKKSQPKAKPATAEKKTMKASGPLAQSWLRDIDDDEDSKTKSSWLQAPKGTSRKSAVASDNINVLKPVSAESTESSSSKQKKQPNSKPTPKEENTSTSTNANGWTTIPHPNKPSSTSDDENDEEEEQSNPMLTQKQSLQQRAFAGDEVAAAFEAEKAAQAASEDEKEVSNHLPGWGSWAGTGLSRSIKKSNARARHNPLFKTKLPGGVKPEDRIDKNMERVIVSQKGEEGVVRKGKKYLAEQLPHEFQSREQYERSRRMPVGPEWVTKGVHQRMTRPRVVVKKGVNVEAISRPVV